jgi:hypothetical protein
MLHATPSSHFLLLITVIIFGKECKHEGPVGFEVLTARLNITAFQASFLPLSEAIFTPIPNKGSNLYIFLMGDMKAKDSKLNQSKHYLNLVCS